MPSNMPDARAVSEALRRAREMQNRSVPQPIPETVPPAAAEEPKTLPESAQKAEAAPVPQAIKTSASPLSFLFQDKERTLILTLLLLLSAESSSTELLFALMYLLL